MLRPSQFNINEVWIAFRLNDAPICTEADGDFNVIALMDAASCLILATEFVPIISAEPSETEARRLLVCGSSFKQQLPKTLYVAENQVADILCAEAERMGIKVIRIPEERLLVFIGEAREGLKAHIGGGSVH